MLLLVVLAAKSCLILCDSRDCRDPLSHTGSQVPLSMRFPRQEFWSVLPFPSPGDVPNPGTKPVSPPLQTDSLLLKDKETSPHVRKGSGL